ncbi:helix-turn-helix transcriptional regulator [Desulfovibrio inopinatus]|uniref:helix-turn-helix transcriptional regulator n=1 Tax=Desulfovibrio inopinatus TaxID=102109 RepID=UPI00316ADBE3
MAHRIHSVCPSKSAIVFVLGGMKTVTRGEERITVRSGEGFFFPARMETTIENIPDGQTGRYEALCLTYDEDMIARVAAEHPHSASAPVHTLESFRIPCDGVIESSAAHVLEMAASDQENERLIALCREELLLVVAGKTDCIAFLWEAASSWSSRCSALVGMDPGRAWTAEGIAERLGTSERTLRRHLKNEGTGVTHILREVRLHTGLALLQVGNTSVSEAAYRCGYNSASRFAGLFKERFGVSPSEVLQCCAVSGQPLAES